MGKGKSSGGSLALVELIDEHGSALVSDFRAYYGLRLGDVLFEQSPREVLALVEGLSAYDVGMFAAHAKGGDEHWSKFIGRGHQWWIAADFYDLFVKAHTPEGKTPGKYPRPSVDPPPNRGLAGLMGAIPRAKTT